MSFKSQYATSYWRLMVT